jgi:hypothetical protein
MELTRLDHQVVMHCFGVPSARLHPLTHRLSLKTIGGYNRRGATAMANQGALRLLVSSSIRRRYKGVPARALKALEQTVQQ